MVLNDPNDEVLFNDAKDPREFSDPKDLLRFIGSGMSSGITFGNNLLQKIAMNFK